VKEKVRSFIHKNPRKSDLEDESEKRRFFFDEQLIGVRSLPLARGRKNY
jgi:hypothetical protein